MSKILTWGSTTNLTRDDNKVELCCNKKLNCIDPLFKKRLAQWWQRRVNSTGATSLSLPGANICCVCTWLQSVLVFGCNHRVLQNRNLKTCWRHTRNRQVCPPVTQCVWPPVSHKHTHTHGTVLTCVDNVITRAKNLFSDQHQHTAVELSVWLFHWGVCRVGKTLNVSGVEGAAAEADGTAHHSGKREDSQQNGPPMSLQTTEKICFCCFDSPWYNPKLHSH